MQGELGLGEPPGAGPNTIPESGAGSAIPGARPWVDPLVSSPPGRLQPEPRIRELRSHAGAETTKGGRARTRPTSRSGGPRAPGSQGRGDTGRGL
jgi:hypothetical protein